MEGDSRQSTGDKDRWSATSGRAAGRGGLAGGTKRTRAACASKRTRAERTFHLCVLALVCALPAPARAAIVSLPASAVLDGPGATGTVELSIDAADGVEGADFRITYDAALVEVAADATVTALSANCLPVSNTATPGVLQVGMGCSQALSGGGVLLGIPLRGVAPGTSALAITRCDLNEGAIACTVQNGSVQVLAPTPTLTGTVTATATVTATGTATGTHTATPTVTLTPTPSATGTVTNTPTITPTRTSTRTVTSTRTASPLPTVRLDPIPSPIVVGAAHTLTGVGFTAGSRVKVYVASSAGAIDQGPFTPTGRTATSLTWNVPASTPLGNGFATVLVINTDQGYIQSNPQSQLLVGAPGTNIPTIQAINGVAVHAVEPTIPLAYVETVVAQGAAVTIGGSGFNNPLVNLFTAAGNLGPLSPQPGGTASQIQVVVPTGAPTGPGSFQVVNNPYTGNVLSNAVSVPIGALVTIGSVGQSGSTVTVTGTGFSVVSVINLFNKQGTAVVNLGGLDGAGNPKIPLNVLSSTQFTFTVPAGAASGPAYVQVVNPPYIPYSSSGNDPDGAFTLVVP